MSRRVEVAIVGLGVAGLRTARLLENAGVEVALFEAARSAGGRLHTAEPRPGVVYEAGAEWIDADHTRMRALVAEHGLEAAPVSFDALVLRDGERRKVADLDDDAFRDEAAVADAAKALCARLGAPPWSGELARGLERRTVADFLTETVRSESGRFWVGSIYRSDEAEELDRVGLLGWLLGFTNYLGRRGDEAGGYRLPCTGSELARQMLARLRAEVRFGALLRAVESRPTGVTLRFDGFDVEVERAVIALPPTCLRLVAFDPAEPRRQAAVAACGFGRGVKLGLLYEEPWWRVHGSGRMHGDGILQDVWEASGGTASVLCVYACGDAGEKLARERDAPARAAEALAAYFPESASAYRGGWLHDWIADPLARGVHSHFPPGYVLEHFAAAAASTGRVHFAGEHTSRWNGFLEGALESAERVTGEILATRSPT